MQFFNINYLLSAALMYFAVQGAVATPLESRQLYFCDGPDNEHVLILVKGPKGYRCCSAPFPELRGIKDISSELMKKALIELGLACYEARSSTALKFWIIIGVIGTWNKELSGGISKMEVSHLASNMNKHAKKKADESEDSEDENPSDDGSQAGFGLD
ncbi:hypothetical protein C8J56DRAFT_900722 [Mycena floridula]|nr:hypothetical protein C8J56DRAFT_900721 [Mycena floridula]KAJ7575756.1 hypothetical protein C8J56DRAFT_900722 [Mycena floridula]